MKTSPAKISNSRLIGIMVLVAVAMFGFGFAMVPLYNVFCELTGLNGKVKNEAAAEVEYVVDREREISIEFVTSTNQNMPLGFRVERSKMKIHPGQYYTVKFYAENQTDRTIFGQAIPSVAPGVATPYLVKTECFCFAEQEFEPHRVKEMPVRFVIAPDLPSEIKDLTLSYTFFDITAKKQKNQS